MRYVAESRRIFQVVNAVRNRPLGGMHSVFDGVRSERLEQARFVRHVRGLANRVNRAVTHRRTLTCEGIGN